jgi:hypothetical protein
MKFCYVAARLSLDVIPTRETDRCQHALLPISKSHLALFFVLSVLLTCCSCSFGKDMSVAEEGVAQFHDQFNAGQFRDIYILSGEQLKKAAPQTQFINFLEGTRRKLGSVKRTSLINWNIKAKPGGTFTSLIYNTEFAEGKGRESFVFEINGEKAILVGYRIKSPLFVTK